MLRSALVVVVAGTTLLAACGKSGRGADSARSDTVMPLPTTQAPMALSDSAPDSLAARKGMPVRGDTGRTKTNSTRPRRY